MTAAAAAAQEKLKEGSDDKRKSRMNNERLRSASDSHSTQFFTLKQAYTHTDLKRSIQKRPSLCANMLPPVPLHH